MVSVVCVVLLQLASVCFPAKVLIVDECNGFIIFVRGSMLMMGIESSVSSSHLRTYLNVRLLDRLCDNFVLGGDDSNFDSI